MKSVSGVLICTSCLSNAKQMVQEAPALLSGVVSCPKCKAKTFAVTELVMYEQDKKGNLAPVNAVLDEDPRVQCLGCGLVMTGDIQHTVLNRVMPVVEDKHQRNS